MNLRDLRYFVSLAQGRSFFSAAAHCAVTQSTLSIQLRKLEDYFGAPLVRRRPRADCADRGGRARPADRARHRPQRGTAACVASKSRTRRRRAASDTHSGRHLRFPTTNRAREVS